MNIIETIKDYENKIAEATTRIKMIEEEWQELFGTKDFNTILQLKKDCDKLQVEVQQKYNELLLLIQAKMQ